jgi:hypothetical protein
VTRERVTVSATNFLTDSDNRLESAISSDSVKEKWRTEESWIWSDDDIQNI